MIPSFLYFDVDGQPVVFELQQVLWTRGYCHSPAKGMTQQIRQALKDSGIKHFYNWLYGQTWIDLGSAIAAINTDKIRG